MDNPKKIFQASLEAGRVSFFANCSKRFLVHKFYVKSWKDLIGCPNISHS
uniref:Uncharacterized protein n=1 Tax=Manihot esculenta TaxID=3983 RepID=A0A2C9VLK1_MANES